MAAAAPQIFASCDATVLIKARPIAVWSREEGDWKQVHGAAAKAPAANGPAVERASCAEAPIGMTPVVRPGVKSGGGESRDRSLVWAWSVAAGGARHFKAQLWTGEAYRTVVEDVVAPAK